VTELDYKKIINSITKDKKLVINLVVILLCGVLLILISDITGNLSTKSTPNSTDTLEVNNTSNATVSDEAYEVKIKQDLENILAQISGVGRTSVLLNFDGSSRTVPALKINNSASKTEEKDNGGGKRYTTENNNNQDVVLINDNGISKPLVLRQNYPTIIGVVIVAEGAEDSVVRNRILMSVRTALNLSQDRIAIMPRISN
jgi:stage III sporulation protein AG